MAGEEADRRTPVEAVEPVSQPESREEVGQAVRYLWPTLASLWQASPHLPQ